MKKQSYHILIVLLLVRFHNGLFRHKVEFRLKMNSVNLHYAFKGHRNLYLIQERDNNF